MKAVFVIGLTLAVLSGCGESGGDKPAAVKPALTVKAVQPQSEDWPQLLKAGGNIAAWQESVIGAEISNYRITEVLANVGDRVRRGQILARIAPDEVDSEHAEIRASVAEAEAMLAEAVANRERARQLREKGFYSAQQLIQAQTAADTAQARLEAARARLNTADLKRAKAAVLAPDDGIIAAREATVGTLTQPGQALFRLIRGGRLEWRGEITAADVGRIRPGMPVALTTPGGQLIEGRVRVVAPTVNPQTHTALVYADLPAEAFPQASAGMFARGEILLGRQTALTLPVTAVLLREGFAYVFRIDGDKVAMTKVEAGRRQGDRVEVNGLDAAARVVDSGVGFLADGDTVRLAE